MCGGDLGFAQAKKYDLRSGRRPETLARSVELLEFRGLPGRAGRRSVSLQGKRAAGISAYDQRSDWPCPRALGGPGEQPSGGRPGEIARGARAVFRERAFKLRLSGGAVTPASPARAGRGTWSHNDQEPRQYLAGAGAESRRIAAESSLHPSVLNWADGRTPAARGAGWRPFRGRRLIGAAAVALGALARTARAFGRVAFQSPLARGGGGR